MKGGERSCSQEEQPTTCQRDVHCHVLERYQPKEGSEHNGSNAGVVYSAVTCPSPVDVTPQHSHSNERCEPENHGQELNSCNGELVSGAREACWSERKVCDCEKGPYRGEEHEVEAVRRPTCPWVGVLVDNWSILAVEQHIVGAIRTVGCQTQDNDSEQCLGTANAQNDSRGDHFVAVVVAATDLGVGRVWCRVWDAVGSLQPAAHHAPFIVRLLDSDDDSHG